MALPTWPAELPQRVLRDGYSEGLRDGRLTTDMETGPYKSSLRYSAAVAPIQFTLDITEDAKERLRRFYEEDTARGSRPFLLPDQSRDGRALLAEPGLQLLDDQGRPLLITAWWLCLMPKGAVPSFVNLGGPWWRASLQISVMP